MYPFFLFLSLEICRQKDGCSKTELEKNMNYQEALEYVEGCKQYGIVPGLDSIRRLLKKLGNPQEELKYVHIAGTNGKGSVLAMLSSVLSRAGHRTGT